MHRQLDVGSAREDQPQRVNVTVAARDERRGRTVLMRPVDVGASVQQQPHSVDVAVLARDVQRRGAVVLLRPIDVRVVLEEQPHSVDDSPRTRCTVASRCQNAPD